MCDLSTKRGITVSEANTNIIFAVMFLIPCVLICFKNCNWVQIIGICGAVFCLGVIVLSLAKMILMIYIVQDNYIEAQSETAKTKDLVCNDLEFGEEDGKIHICEDVGISFIQFIDGLYSNISVVKTFLFTNSYLREHIVDVLFKDVYRETNDKHNADFLSYTQSVGELEITVKKLDDNGVEKYQKITIPSGSFVVIHRDIFQKPCLNFPLEVISSKEELYRKYNLE